jgi:hypothetical protein
LHMRNLAKWLRLEIGDEEVQGLILCRKFHGYGPIYGVRLCI